MRARPYGERLRFILRIGAFGESGCTFGGRPGFRFASVTAELAARRARASLSVAISASMSETMSFSSMPEL